MNTSKMSRIILNAKPWWTPKPTYVYQTDWIAEVGTTNIFYVMNANTIGDMLPPQRHPLWLAAKEVADIGTTYKKQADTLGGLAEVMSREQFARHVSINPPPGFTKYYAMDTWLKFLIGK